MKTKSFKGRWALILGALLCFILSACIYFFGGVTEELTDALSYRQTGNGGKITNETSISQGFVCPYDQVTAVTLRVSTFQNPFDQGQAVLTLADESGREIARQETPLSELKDKGPLTFHFELLENAMGKAYTLTAAGKELPQGQAYSLMIGPGSIGGSLTTAEGKASDQNSLFMTVTYQHPIKALSLTFFFIIAGVVLLSLSPMAAGKKEAR